MKLGIRILSIYLFLYTSIFNDLTCFSQFSTPNNELTVLNYSVSDKIEKLKKLEIGIRLNDEINRQILSFLHNNTSGSIQNLNPFSERDIDIEAEFVHSQSGTIKKREFFYYLQYRRNTIKNDWEIDGNLVNDSSFRVRFAPPLSGVWLMNVKVMIKDSLYSKIVPFEFSVIENENQGIVSVHENKRNLERNGELILPMGHVFPGPYNGVAVWGADAKKTNKAADVADWNAFQNDIREYIMKGGKYIKTTETSYGNLLEFEQLGNYLNRLHYAWEEDKILDLCEEYDVLINFNLLFQDVFMGYGQSGSPFINANTGKMEGYCAVPWDYGNYGPDKRYNPREYYPNYGYFVEGTHPSNMFTQDELLYWHKQRTRYYISRYGYSPQIYTWELLSEPWHLNEYGEDKPAQTVGHPDLPEVLNAINNYNIVISDYIKDELKDEHLITICQFYPEGIKPELLYSSGGHHNIDMVGINPYSSRPDRLIIAKSSSGNENNVVEVESETSFYKDITSLQELYNKPVILSEYGHGRDKNCMAKTGNNIDVMSVGFTGVAAVCIWGGYSYSNNPEEFDERQLWDATISAERFFEQHVLSMMDTLNGNWIQGRQTANVLVTDWEDVKEVQYYLSEDGSKGAGYVRNLSYNIHNFRLNENCNLNPPVPLDSLYSFSWKEGKNGLYVTGLIKKSKYKIVWYDFITGDYISEQQFRLRRKNKTELKYPDLTFDDPMRPIVWFRLEKIER